MNIASTTAVQSATADAQASSSDAVNIAVLKKALNVQETVALGLIQSLPQTAPPATQLAISGSLGTQLNTYA